MHESNPREFQAKSLPGGSSTGLPAARPDADDNPLRALSADEFAALGNDEVVYRRTVSGALLKTFVPQAEGAPDSQAFHILFGAGGTPRFVSDDESQLHEWLSQTGMALATRH